MSILPTDYAARAYAGVLGKIIGVYLGRPFEQWPYERIESTFGDIQGYVHEKVGAPLIVTDDDITGTFTFVRALEDNGSSTQLTAEQIGWNWLNYIIENRTILWWGGLGYAAEHTAFLRLKNGIMPPQSGSIALNGAQVAEEIGSQIFIEGWALVAPGKPALAAEFACKAASVSHDREGIYGAQVIAAMAAQAFVENDLNALIDCALSLIPAGCEIAQCINDVRRWHQEESDWRQTRLKIVEKWGYGRYGTNCPIVSNHAIVMLGLLYGEDDFSRSLQITCNAAYDTDCNAANVGAILGIKNGLAGIDNSDYDWRGPVADRLYLPTAEGGSCFSDALSVSTRLVNQGRILDGLQAELPKNGARFHFSQPGSVQGFIPSENSIEAIEISNGASPWAANERALRLRATGTTEFIEAYTETFAVRNTGNSYDLVGNPTIFSGQTLHAEIRAGANSGPIEVAFVLCYYDGNDEVSSRTGVWTTLQAGQNAILKWQVPDFDGQPIARCGCQIRGAENGDVLWVNTLTWDGEPDVSFHAPKSGGEIWKRAWVDAVDSRVPWIPDYNVIVQNRGRGLISTGTLDWRNYRTNARFKLRAARGGGLAIRYGGLERYYGLMLRRNAQLVLFKRRDGVENTLAEVVFEWEFEALYDLWLEANGPSLSAGIGNQVLLTARDDDQPLLSGGIALLVEEGCLLAERTGVNSFRLTTFR